MRTRDAEAHLSMTWMKTGTGSPTPRRRMSPRKSRDVEDGGSAGGGGMGAGGMMGGRPSRKGSRKSQADLEKEQQEEVEQKKKELAAKLVADNDEPPSTKDEAAKKDNQAPGSPEQQFQGGHKGTALDRHHRRSRPRQAGRKLPRGAQEPRCCQSALRPAGARAAITPERRFMVEVGESRFRGEPQDPR